MQSLVEIPTPFQKSSLPRIIQFAICFYTGKKEIKQKII
uniref:Uncharacterized protein n=1 Tax=Anguilla anguilla TaxID=7936 RepID=A0A0E9UFR3_ANGAN